MGFHGKTVFHEGSANKFKLLVQSRQTSLFGSGYRASAGSRQSIAPDLAADAAAQPCHMTSGEGKFSPAVGRPYELL
jgi:hypothetical protein